MVTTTLFKIIQSELFKKGFNHEIVDGEGNLTFFDYDSQVMSKVMNYDEDVQRIIDSLFMNKLKDKAHDIHFKKGFMFKFLNRQINKQTVESFKFDLISIFMTNEDYINRIYADMDKYILRVSESESGSNTHTTSLDKGRNESISTSSETGRSENSNTSNETGKSVNNTDSTSTQRDSSTSKSDNESTDRKATSDLPNSTLSFNLNDNSFSNPSTADAGRSKGKTSTVNDGNSESKQHSKGNTNDERQSESNGNSNDERQSESNGINTDERQTESNTETNQNTFSRVYSLDELFKTSNVLEKIYRKFDERCFLQTW